MNAKNRLLGVVCLILILLMRGNLSFSQGTWVQKTSLPAPERLTAVAFTIGNKGYLGTGYNTFSSGFDDFWEYDPASDTWTQKANFGGGPRSFAVGFTIGNKGYIGTGIGGGGNVQNDLWEYDAALNSWTQKANVGVAGGGRAGNVGFSIGSKGYIATGLDAFLNLTQDLWEWDQATNVWTQKANYLGGNMQDIDRAVFVISGKAYLGTGHSNTSFPATVVNDFWEYNPVINVWTQKANFAGVPRGGATGFELCGKGYLGLGTNWTPGSFYSDFWQYDPIANSWTASAALFPGRLDAPSFVINGKAYIGTGAYSNSSPYDLNDLWEYTPQNPCATLNITTTQTNPLCNGQCTGTATATPTNGTSPFTYSWSNAQTTQTITGLCAGTYSVLVTDAISSTTTATVTITQPAAISLTITSTPAACGSASGTATVNASGGTSPYAYLWNPTGQVTQTATGLSPGTYTTTVTDANGCTQTQAVTVTMVSGPNATVSASPMNIILGDSTQLTATGGITYSWAPSTGLSCITCANPTATATATITYCVFVTDANGCTDSACITINVEIPCGNIFVPNAFSPNSDGQNELECVLGDCIETFLFSIYDRWGEQVFETTNQKICWDGTYKGKPMNTAAFVYYLEATLTNGEKISRKGNISLIR